MALDAVKPALPIVPSGKIVCVGLNYALHAKEGGHAIPTYPSFFLRVPTSLVAAGAPVIRPKCSIQLDYECELTIVIGKGGRHISEAKALDHVFGYTLFNDVSVRDFQRKTSQWTPGKNFDGTGPLGPWVVTADELPAGASGLRIMTRVNGETMQDSNTADMIFSTAKTIAFLSEFMTLEAGDVIATGTPSGVAHARKPPAWMKAGDKVRGGGREDRRAGQSDRRRGVGVRPSRSDTMPVCRDVGELVSDPEGLTPYLRRPPCSRSTCRHQSLLPNGSLLASCSM